MLVRISPFSTKVTKGDLYLVNAKTKKIFKTPLDENFGKLLDQVRGISNIATHG